MFHSDFVALGKNQTRNFVARHKLGFNAISSLCLEIELAGARVRARVRILRQIRHKIRHRSAQTCHKIRHRSVTDPPQIRHSCQDLTHPLLLTLPCGTPIYVKVTIYSFCTKQIVFYSISRCNQVVYYSTHNIPVVFEFFK